MASRWMSGAVVVAAVVAAVAVRAEGVAFLRSPVGPPLEQGVATEPRLDAFYIGLLDGLPAQEKVERALESNDTTRRIAEKYSDCNNFLYLGRQYNFPTALEGALKLKEISYIHAEGYPAAEMKHGPIALVDERTPSVFIVPQGAVYDKVLANVEEI